MSYFCFIYLCRWADEGRGDSFFKVFRRNLRFETFSHHNVDLWISLSDSRAKLDEEADFEVHSAVAHQKPCQISEKQNFWSKFLPNKFFGHRKTKRQKSYETCFGKVS